MKGMGFGSLIFRIRTSGNFRLQIADFRLIEFKKIGSSV